MSTKHVFVGPVDARLERADMPVHVDARLERADMSVHVSVLAEGRSRRPLRESHSAGARRRLRLPERLSAQLFFDWGWWGWWGVDVSICRCVDNMCRYVDV